MVFVDEVVEEVVVFVGYSYYGVVFGFLVFVELEWVVCVYVEVWDVFDWIEVGFDIGSYEEIVWKFCFVILNSGIYNVSWIWIVVFGNFVVDLFIGIY